MSLFLHVPTGAYANADRTGASDGSVFVVWQGDDASVGRFSFTEFDAEFTPVAAETHWDITITQPVVDDVTTVRVDCGCGWFTTFPKSTAANIARARKAWDDHPCLGRPFEGND